MSSVVTFSGTGLSRLDRQTAVQIHASHKSAAIQAARIDGMALVTETAMMRAAQLSALEGQLAEMVPWSAPRLRAISDSGVLGMAIIVQQTARSI